MTNSEFLTFKILQYLNDNRKDEGVSIEDVVNNFQAIRSEPFSKKFFDSLIEYGLIIKLENNSKLKITLIGE